MSQEDGFGDFDSCQEVNPVKKEETIEEIVSRIRSFRAVVACTPILSRALKRTFKVATRQDGESDSIRMPIWYETKNILPSLCGLLTTHLQLCFRGSFRARHRVPQNCCSEDVDASRP